MKIPKSKYNVGDPVMVRCEESPEFPATVSGVRWEGRANHHSYEVTEESALVSDGYTEEWLSPRTILNTADIDMEKVKAAIAKKAQKDSEQMERAMKNGRELIGHHKERVTSPTSIVTQEKTVVSRVRKGCSGFAHPAFCQGS